jgi:UDP-3-O-[3-hydroxymyristoyl] N-acetylglucosamine deacetylase/UDP-3-O-[3-hydroxymyristoyl] N-acetylglucosamine deacetylase/3-hydroxyacyl-[acyl-carrier-protein] dehydratase
MNPRVQRTIERAAVVTGVGLFGGTPVRVEFLPAPEFHGVVFQRVDLPERVRIPARIEYVVERPRRTALSRLGATVEVTEHVLAALAGLRIDNCLVRIDAPELPNGDGSARHFADALWDAGLVEQAALVTQVVVERCLFVGAPCETPRRDTPGTGAGIAAAPANDGAYRVRYDLDYGTALIPRQSLQVDVTPETFVNEIAWARTFILEAEVAALRAAGLGLRTTARDLLVFGADGRTIDNELRSDDECVRHKVLDCIGDFALAGSDLVGEFRAQRSGHELNRALVRSIRSECGVRRRWAA